MSCCVCVRCERSLADVQREAFRNEGRRQALRQVRDRVEHEREARAAWNGSNEADAALVTITMAITAMLTEP